MANTLYDHGREGFLAGDIDWDADTIKVCLVDEEDYTVDLANHETFNQVTAGSRATNGISGAFTSKTVAAGVADAANVTLTQVSGDESEALVIYQDDGGCEDTSRLIAYINSATGLPVILNGGDININWDDGSDKIFKL